MTEYNSQLYEIKEEQIDVKAIFRKIFSSWKLILVSLVVIFFIAFLFNRYSEKIYETQVSILIQDDKNSGADIQSMIGFGIGNSVQNLQNQIGILQSRTIVEKTVKALDFKISYYSEGRVINSEIYKDSPFVVILDTFALQPASNIKFFVSGISNDEFLLEVEGENVKLYNYFLYENADKTVPKVSINKKFKFGQHIETDAFAFTIIKNPNITSQDISGNRYFFQFNTLNSMVRAFSNFSIATTHKESSIVNVSIKHSNAEKAADFLNTLAKIYIQQGLDKKNIISINTINFIDSQLSEISDSLSKNENVLQDFRSKNFIMNLDDQSVKVYDYIMELENQKGELIVKNKLYQNLKEYISSNLASDEPFTPPALGVEDPLLLQQLRELMELYSKRSERMVSDNPNNPLLLEVDRKINLTKKSLNESINNIMVSSDIKIKDIDGRIEKLSSSFSNLPSTERQLLDIERKYKLNDAIYTYLLQKRSEASIAKASNTSDNEIIDSAISTDSSPVSPKQTLNYFIALCLGLVLPIGFIFVKDFFNDNVESKSDIEKATNATIIGNILHNHYDTNTPVINYPKSAIAETYRSLRTNLRYIVKGKEHKVFLVTSLMVGEGKTFISINLASIYANSNKKTLLMGYDLRKPKIYQDFGLTNTAGISSYLLGEHTMQEIIQKTKYPNLDIISSGPIPPNPAELIGSSENYELIKELSEIYDYIIIDTPPIGIVTDALLLFSHVDVRIFVVRQNYSSKKLLANITSEIENNYKESFYIVFNGIDPKLGSDGYGYGHKYGYGYSRGYGYYSDDSIPKNKNSWFNRLFSKK
ncbi:MAG: GumC family protein [Bacteroidales bacterium]|jgi:tyrosine-protein kinase Etk/Wzc